MGNKRRTPHPSLAFGAPWRHYARTDSTNTRARELAAAGAPGGTVVTAAEQTAGRGRQGRTWTAPPRKALLYSALLRPLGERHVMLPLAVPLAVCEAAEALAPGTECGVKWPNDVLVGGRKLAGILVEARPRDGWAVIGVGLNLTIGAAEFPPELRDAATSLFPDPRAVPFARNAEMRNSPAAVLSERLGRWVGAQADEVLAAWRERDALRGRAIAWEDGSGVAEGVDERGFLLVRLADGDRVALGAGEVHLTSF
ncbi:MAG TPA: biotin--[acetyl-CoA-carboxylase] ligase [Solirubrobacterales bacterium]|jgi:BirA family biotin operon repressor/biotin-[acetyl-CoA-carboxylase] ligase